MPSRGNKKSADERLMTTLRRFVEGGFSLPEGRQFAEPTLVP